MTPNTDSRETTIELITASLLIAIIVLYLLGVVAEGIAMLLGGVTLLGSGVYQTSRGWHVSLITWIFGIILTLGGLGTAPVPRRRDPHQLGANRPTACRRLSGLELVAQTFSASMRGRLS